MRAGLAITQEETIRTRAENHRETDDFKIRHTTRHKLQILTHMFTNTLAHQHKSYDMSHPSLLEDLFPSARWLLFVGYADVHLAELESKWKDLPLPRKSSRGSCGDMMVFCLQTAAYTNSSLRGCREDEEGGGSSSMMISLKFGDSFAGRRADGSSGGGASGGSCNNASACGPQQTGGGLSSPWGQESSESAACSS
ncbi:hypothetical protein EYF80_006114 [Liparis tanakae]|uniref:Uncharacterized protein n=1 Tax=Liparis tanakae TaxID=230148 RepID=A0A4Z2J097_9TELE|nr:hypothetical protein EYF80_006114 [Liparis tanakae]